MIENLIEPEEPIAMTSAGGVPNTFEEAVQQLADTAAEEGYIVESVTASSINPSGEIVETISGSVEYAQDPSKEGFPLFSQDSQLVSNFWDAVRMRFLQALMQGDQIIAILIREDAIPEFTEGYAALTLPEELAQEQPDLPMRFEQAKASVQMHPIALDQVKAMLEKGLPAYQSGFRIISQNEHNFEYLMGWKEETKLDSLLERRGCPFRPSYQELRLLFLFQMLQKAENENPYRILTPQPIGPPGVR
jgi:exonuclease VII small subunit